MRNLSLFGCVLVLIVSSGCQSGSYGFRNPFKHQFARTFPNSVPELLTKSKDAGTENQGVYDLGGEASVDTSAGVPSVSDSEGSFNVNGHGQFSEIDTILERGDAEYAAGNLLPAAGHYREALARDPQNVHAHHRLAIIHDQQEDYAAAEQHYEAALNSEPQNFSILNDLGYSYYLQQRYEDSKAHLEYIRRIQPDNQLAMRNLALVHAAEGDLQQAYALFQQSGLSAEQSRPLIQQAVARVNQGESTTGNSRTGVASANSQPPGMSSIKGIATVKTDNLKDSRSTDSQPGRSGTQSPRGDAFQPRPDYESAYGLSANQPTGNPQPSAGTEMPASQSFAPEPQPRKTQPSLAQQEQPADYGVERVSYTPPLQQYEPSASDEEMIRTALNTGYGNLFPVIAPKDYYRTQRDIGVNYGVDARNAYYEQFGPQESSTPYVVHADSNEPAKSDISRNTMQNVSYERSRAPSYGSPRIQTPSDRPDQQAPATTPVPANRFPVTEPARQNYQNSDYARFPRPERPPFINSSGSNAASNPATRESGTLIVPNSGTSVPQHDAMGTGGGITNHSPPDEADSYPHNNAGNTTGLYCPIVPDETNSYSYDDGPQVAPMSEQAQKAHELALERYRQMQQQ